MLKRIPFALPCLTAVGLLAGCATTPAPSIVAANVAQGASAPRKLPAVPPLPEVSPLLQLGLIVPTPRPNFHDIARKAPEAEVTETVADAGAPAPLSDDAKLNLEQRASFASIAASPESDETYDIALSAHSHAPGTALASVALAAADAPVDLPVEVAINTRIDFSSVEVASVELPPITTAQPGSVDLPVQLAIAVKLPAPTDEVAATDSAEDTVVADLGVDLPAQVLAALPPVEPRRRHANPVAIAQTKSQAPATAEGGPELPFKLRH